MRNLTMLTDLYQFTMMYGYFKNGKKDNTAVFDMFFRSLAGDTSYAVMAGLEQVIDYINDLRFDDDDLNYLSSLGLFDEEFIEYLSEFEFTGDIYAMPEGTVVFPYEPLIRDKAPIIEAQFIETAVLNIVNHQTLIATKANRMLVAADGDKVIEFGLRRAQGPDAGIYGARAAIIGGCAATSNVLTGQLFGIPIRGTHGHSWVMSFSTELEAFRAYAEVFPDECLLLVDTYDTLKSGVPNAITVFQALKENRHKPVGIRLDSGDLAYLSKEARKMLDEAGFKDAIIFASSDLDENIIYSLKAQGSRIDVWGVGTKLITSGGWPALGGVYKLAAEEIDGEMIPKIKVSDTLAKTTNPGVKKVMRIYGKDTGKAIADLIMLDDEVLDETRPLRLFDPIEPWKSMVLSSYTVKELLQPVFLSGKQVYTAPPIVEIQEYCKAEVATLWDEYKRFVSPHNYKVDMSEKLYRLKKSFLQSASQMY